MNVEHVKAQLERILETPFRSSQIPIDDWPKQAVIRNQRSRARSGELADWMEDGSKINFRLFVDGSQVRHLSAEAALITESERQLVVLAIDAIRASGRSQIRDGKSEDERTALSIRDWIDEQLRDHTLIGTE